MLLDFHRGVSRLMPKRHSSRFLLRVQLAGKAPSPMSLFLRPAGSSIDASDEQPRKAWLPMLVRPAGRGHLDGRQRVVHEEGPLGHMHLTVARRAHRELQPAWRRLAPPADAAAHRLQDVVGSLPAVEHPM